MGKIRLNELSRELEIPSRLIIEYLHSVGVGDKKSHSSALNDDLAEKVRKRFGTYEQNTRDSTSLPRIPGPAPSDSPDLLSTSPAPFSLQPSAGPIAAVGGAPSVGGPADGTAAGAPPSRPAQKPVDLALPEAFSFYTPGFVDFDYVIAYFDWSLHDRSLTVDLTGCRTANFQAVALLVQYAWYLTMNGCTVSFRYPTAKSGLTQMFTRMGALDWREVLVKDGLDFSNTPGRKTFALRRRSDVQNAINNARARVREYSTGFPGYLSWIISELLYNATEHGRRAGVVDNCQILVPSIFQFGRYPLANRLSFFFSDLGIGIKAHLEKSYPPFSTHQEAMIYALRPNVSGTFQQQSQPYGRQDNAGMGLTVTSQLMKKLKGDMYIVSHNGVVHVSPEDVTSHQMRNAWPGTFVLINLNVGEAPSVSLEGLMAEIRINANKELDAASQKEESARYFVSIFNYFGKYAEDDKDAAIRFRDRHLMPAIESGKKVDVDFRDVETAPHSFLNALLATPIRRLGPKAYQWIRIYNAPGHIHEIIDKVLEDNLPKMQ